MTQMPSYRQLRRSATDRKIAGVCGGIAEYLNVDPTVIRIAAIALTVITGGAFIVAYVIALVVMPDTPRDAPVWNYAPTDRPGQPGAAGQPASPAQPGSSSAPASPTQPAQGFPGEPGAVPGTPTDR
jgi:phage shock protein C